MKKADGIRKAVLTLVMIVIGFSAGGWWVYSSHKAGLPAAAPQKPFATENGPFTGSQSPAPQKEQPVPPVPGTDNGLNPGWTYEDNEIAGLTTDMSPQEVLAVLGEPEKKEQRIEPDLYHSGNDLYLDSWSYPGLEVTFSDFGTPGEEKHNWNWVVCSIKVTGGRYATHRGVRVGDPVEKIIGAYGPPQIQSDYTYSAYLSEIPAWDFEVVNGVVTRIELYVDW